MKTGTFFPESKLFSFFSFLLFCLLPLLAPAQLIGKYEFTGVSTLETQNNFSEVTTQPYYAVFSPFKRTVVQWWRGDNVYNSREWGKTIADERFVEFSVTAKAGYALLLTSLSFDNYRTETGPVNVRIAHNANGGFNGASFTFLPAISDVSKTTWDFDDIVTPVGGSVTFRIYGYDASSYLGAFRVDNVSLFGSAIPQVKVNEFHYANTAVTKTGFVEIAVPKYFTGLSNVQMALYNSTGNVYSTFYLSSFKSTDLGTDPDEKLYYLDIPAGLAEGQGAFCIYAGNHVIQLLSYGGAFTAMSGPAAGLKSQDVNITETAVDGPENSLYLALKNNPHFAPGTWGKGADNSNTKGLPNTENEVLPVELLYFRVQANPKEVSLNWATATEKNNEQFVVERSHREVADFRPLGTIKGHGNTTTQQQYQFTDRKPVPGTSYYRLKQIDADGTISYSPTIAVNVKIAEEVVSLYPNPAASLLHVNLGNNNAYQAIDLKIINTMGKVVYQQSATNLGRNILSVPVSGLPAGTYYLILIKDGAQKSTAFLKR
ncbi:MAG: C-terminal target protein [Adhaeribacter sp.]|nr:C-terminal target protein [Adhaeribacter sp.]